MSSERLELLTSALQQYVDDEALPGVVVRVHRSGNVVYEEALGWRDREAGAPMRGDALFRIASQTKAVVSVAIMMLQEEGTLLISDPLHRWLPAFRETTVAESDGNGGYDVVPARRAITLRDLLTHTAGVGYGYGLGGDAWEAAGITGWYFAHRSESVRETIDRMAALPFPAQPGQAFVYGYSTDILGAVVEAASGMALDDFLAERLFQPLDMRDTHFFVPPAKEARLAVVYNQGEGLPRAPEGPGMDTQGQYVDGPRASFSGGAGLVSTARDYSRFLQMLLDGGELEGERLLSPSTVALMTTDHIEALYGAPGMGFGLGFSVRDDVGAGGVPGSEGDYGWGGAYHTTYWVDPAEELVVVYLTQVRPGAGLDDHARLRALLYASVLESSATGSGT